MGALSLKCEKGFSLLQVLMLGGFLAAGAAGALKVMDNRVHALRIMRTDMRFNTLAQKIRNAALSRHALSLSAAKQTELGLLRQCFEAQQCRANTKAQFVLYNSAEERLTGTFYFNGQVCNENDANRCHLRVSTQFSVSCANGSANCERPEEIVTYYQIEQIDNSYIRGRRFETLEDEVSLATFACPADQYVVAVDAKGRMMCDAPVASLNSNQCPDGEAAYGLTPDGRLNCRKVVNYCNLPVSIASVIDTSTSMNSGDKINLAKAQTSSFLRRLGGGDTAGAVGFGSTGTLLANLNSNIAQVRSSIINMSQPRGASNMTDGLRLANQLLNGAAPNAQKGVILLSDGMHNVGESPYRLARQLKDRDIKIWTIGLGNGADANTLRKISSGPDYYFSAAEPGDLEKAYGEIAMAVCRNEN